MAQERRHAARRRAAEGDKVVRISTKRDERARSRRRRWWLGLAALASLAALAFAGWALLHTSIFSVHRLELRGATELQQPRVLAASGISDGTPLVSIDAASSTTAIEAIPWVKQASVELRWPSGVTITVTQRRPVATMAAGGRQALIDEQARIIGRPAEVPSGMDPTPLPLAVDGVRAGRPGTYLPSSARPAVKVAAKVPPAFRSQVARVVGHRDGTVSLEMTAPVRVDLGPAERLHAKFVDIAAIIAGTRLHAGDVVDVSVPQASTITRGQPSS